MSLDHVKQKIEKIIKNFSRESFIYDLLLAYDTPKATITRLQKGTSNLAKGKEEILLKKKLFFKEIQDADLHASIDTIRHDPQILKYFPRFLIVTDYISLLSIDTKTEDTLDIHIEELPKNIDFFLPWAGMEKSRTTRENPVDIKAAEKLSKLYDFIRIDNPNMKEKEMHELNIFLSRLLFCFFSEDTEIFEDNVFSNSLASHTQDDGSDLNIYLDKLFEALNVEDKKSFPVYLQKFPYVNGGLFGDKIKSPKFTRRSRKLVIECGAELDWSQINPDIFGSMIQVVAHPEERHAMGMHYTSIANIMKVIEPLFLSDLNEDFEKCFEDSKKLDRLLVRLSNLRIFDPACGSGNFLIISYKEMRKLEMRIFQRLRELRSQVDAEYSNIKLNQFYGIEIDDFAHEIAILSLWLTEHQMNIAFKREFGQTRPTLPLSDGGKIVCGNATRLNWREICPVDNKLEIYVLGNPPYLGARYQNKNQKSDVVAVLNEINGHNNLDYISCWIFKASSYLDENVKVALVSTNSITQGTQVSILWPSVFDLDVEIFFAHRSFKWSNNAKSNAGVTCVIIGLRKKSKEKKVIYQDSICLDVDNINPYLADSRNIFIHKRRSPLFELPRILFGSMPNDSGYLHLSKDEMIKAIKQDPETKKFIRKIVGAKEFIDCEERYCIWIDDKNVKEAMRIKFINDRIRKVRSSRLASKRLATRKLAEKSYKFAEIRFKSKDYILIPSITSELREYIPIGLIHKDIVANNRVHTIFNFEPYIFGLLSSKMHVIWVKAVAGRLETRLIYSAEICYNNFPVPDLSVKQKERIATHSFNVIGERERYSELTIAQLYNPDLMPCGLKEAHMELDKVVEHCYRAKPFDSDEDRLNCLFKLYEDRVEKENSCQT